VLSKTPGGESGIVGLGLSVPPAAANAGIADIASIMAPNSSAAIFLFN
jgi:hypothetical protein